MRAFIFVTHEGYTFQPASEAEEPDIENLQVLGFALGVDEEQAFQNLKADYTYLLKTSFDETLCLELRHEDYFARIKYFYLKDFYSASDYGVD